MTSDHDNQPRGSGLLLGAGAALLMIVCCALLPIVVAGGVLAGVGVVLRNPWVIGAGTTVAVLALIAVSRRRGGTAGDDCCPPLRTNEPIDLKDEPKR